MSVQIKSLTIAAPTVDNSVAAPNDNFNTIPTADTVYDLYTAANQATEKKAAIVNSVRLINTHPTNTAKVTLYFNRPNPSGQSRRRLLTPADMSLAPNFMYIDDAEITLKPGDKIQGKADLAGVVQYVISGVERDVL